MTSHLDSHTTTDVKPYICYKVSKLEMEFHMIDINIRGIAHARINRKDDIFIFMLYRSGAKGLVKNQDRTRHELTQP